MKKLESLQAARGLAAFSVLLYHIDYLHRGGFGVDVFFVISGFIISFITRKNLGSVTFLKRRAFRILPTYYLITLVIFFAGYFSLVKSNGTDYSVKNLMLSLAFIPYLDLNGFYRPVVGLGWTLNYEIYFYLVYMISMSMSHKFRDILAPTLIVVMLFASPQEYYRDPIVLEFILGIILANLSSRTEFRKILHPGLAAVLLLASIVLLFVLDPYALAGGPLLRFGLFGPLSFLVVALCMQLEGLTPRFASHLGDWSYSLYLTHVYVIVLIIRTMGQSWLSNLIGASLAIALSFLFFNLFEMPSNRWLRKLGCRQSADAPQTQTA